MPVRAMLLELRGWSKVSVAAILLGTSLNILEAVSIGLLIFPPAEPEPTFAGLQSQAMSLYIMSTVVSQVTLTCGGSSMPSAMGSMLAEALPFLRSIAAAIQKELGPGHPGVLPTTMVAYASTSLLLGIMFLGLAVLRCGRLTAYFPRTVMTGVVGAVGVSLICLGLEITLPSATPHLGFSTLFYKAHLPLLAASLGPAIVLSLSTRLSCLDRLPAKPMKHPLYIPLFCCAVAGVFWLVVAACQDISMQMLASTGWLFAPEQSPAHATAGAEWNYWVLFDFSHVEWRAFSAGISDILLLVFIGALSLPIFASAAALEWGGPDHSMNHEFVGHGISNTLAGAVGALPNLFVYSNSRFFHRAGGGRREAAIVALCTLAFLFVSFRVLPFVPTIQASALVLFVGIELTLEALWDSTASLTCSEWTVVAGTTVACTSLGFAPGVGAGLAIVVVVQFCCHVLDTRPQATQPCTHVSARETNDLPPVLPLLTSFRDTLSKDVDSPVARLRSPSSPVCPDRPALPPVVRLKGRIGSTIIPLLERILAELDQGPFIILDLQAVDAIETSVAEYIQSQIERILQRHGQPLSIVVRRSQLAVMADLERGKVNKLQYRAHEALEEAIRDARYGNMSAPCVPNAKLDAADSLDTLRSMFQANNDMKPTLAELRWKGLRSSFIILEGLVAVRQRRAATPDTTHRKCIRKAVPQRVAAMFQHKDKPAEQDLVMMEGSLCGAGPKIVTPQVPFCARVESRICWILDFHSTHDQLLQEIVEQSRQSGTKKEMGC